MKEINVRHLTEHEISNSEMDPIYEENRRKLHSNAYLKILKLQYKLLQQIIDKYKEIY
jgi:hypothetical protein